MSANTRRDEIAAKRAKLAELKQQREYRQKELQSSRQSLDAVTSFGASFSDSTSRTPNRADLDELISSLVDRPSGSAITKSQGVSGQSSDNHVSEPGSRNGTGTPNDGSALQQRAIQTLGIAQLRTVYDAPSAKSREVITYSKGVQTSGDLPGQERAYRVRSRESDTGDSDDGIIRRRKSLSKLERDRRRDDELRAGLRREIEEELRAIQDKQLATTKDNFPVRALDNDELTAVTGSDDFLAFVEHSSKVIERALEEEYDVLADYAAKIALQEEDEDAQSSGRKGRRIKQILQFKDDVLTKRRMVSDLDFAAKHPELLLASYTKATNSPHSPRGLVLLWNAHMTSRPEYKLTASSDVLCAQFSPFHPNIVLAGTYAGQVCMWDTRQRSHDGAPVQRTPLAGERGGHAHPVYSLAVIGTQNASSIISVSTDGTTCTWSMDMLSKPQEHLELSSPPGRSRTEDLAPTCISFPRSDPTYFLAGTEDGSLVPVHRYDRAGAKAGVDQRIVYRGHTAPVTGLDFHPNRGKTDLGDLALTSGMDWSVKLWRATPHAVTGVTTSSVANKDLQIERPLLDFQREDVVYDVKWSPTKPGVFGAVDGAGRLEIFDINLDVQVPVATARPDHIQDDVIGVKSLNKLAWEHNEGKRVAVGGIDGVVTLFEVGNELGGADALTKTDEWMSVKKYVARLDRSRRDESDKTA